MKLYTISITAILLACGALAGCQGNANAQGPAPDPKKPIPQGATSNAKGGQDDRGEKQSKQDYDKWLKSIKDAENKGVEVRIKDIARFRGVRGNQLLGYGLVVGLDGSGDTKNTPFTQTLLANAMKFAGTVVDPTLLKVKNVAVVSVTAGRAIPFCRISLWN